MNDQTLTFLADESCDFAFVKVLRQNNYDIKAVVEVMPGVSDLKVLDSAFTEKRILLTEDKDFGEWIFAQKSATSGIILFRYNLEARYPDEKLSFYKKCTLDFTSDKMQQIEEMREWLLLLINKP